MFKWLASKFMSLVSFFESFRKEMYQVELEAYISSRARHTGDVDRLIREFESRSRLY